MAVSFDFRKRLGSGYFGDVWHAVDTGLNFEVALKCIPTDRIVNQDNFFQEAQALKASEHPNIVRVYDTGFLEDDRIYVSMEYLPKGSLEDEARGAPVALTRAKRIMVDVLRGLGHAHSKNIVHRDIKPANIMIGNAEEAKLSDFGLALPEMSHIDLGQLKEYQYILHLAPEVRKIGQYTYLSDIYAAGVTLYRLVNGDGNLPPIKPADAQRLARRGEFPPRDGYRDFVPQSLKRLINKAIQVNPDDRFQSADEMRRALESQVIKVDWTESGPRDRMTWLGTSGGQVRYKLTKVRRNKGNWEIETKRGKVAGPMRRIGNACVSGISKQDADKRARRILQDFVSGKR